MHLSSFKEMNNFVDLYLQKNKKLKIIDIGSQDINGTYKSLFENKNWNYVGLDICAGKNVDIISKDLYDWPIEDSSFDIVISGQCLEHVEDIYKWIREVERIIIPGGIICIIVPCSQGEHKYPIDCWRLYPDGMKFLLEKIGKLQIINVFHNGNDCIGIAKKYYNFLKL